jgi:predicted metal-dependent peptidase
MKTIRNHFKKRLPAKFARELTDLAHPANIHAKLLFWWHVSWDGDAHS